MGMHGVGKFCNLGPLKSDQPRLIVPLCDVQLDVVAFFFDDRTNLQDISPLVGSNFCWNRLGALAKKFSKTGPGDVCSRASRH